MVSILCYLGRCNAVDLPSFIAGSSAFHSEGLMSKNKTKLRLLFVDNGVYHHEDIEIPAKLIEQHPRLIDCLREEPAVLQQLHVDITRLCAAYRTD